jgi:hypothetical protein
MRLLKPILSESRPAMGERIASAMAPGVRTRPVAAGESPLACETSNGTITRHETLASMEKKPTSTAATYPRLRKIPGETNGFSAVVILHAKPAAASAAPTKLPHDEGEPNPAPWPCVIPNRNNPAASPSNTPPGTSKLRSSVGSVSGST